MTGVQTCALPISAPVEADAAAQRHEEEERYTGDKPVSINSKKFSFQPGIAQEDRNNRVSEMT